VNAVATTFAANNAGIGNFVEFQNATGFTVGQVATIISAPCFTAAATGVTTAGNGNVALCNNAGTLTIGTATAGTGINVGTGTVRIQSAGGVTQTAQGIITADALGVRAVGDVNLDVAVNAVATTFAANNTGAGNFVEFQNATGFTIGQVTTIA